MCFWRSGCQLKGDLSKERNVRFQFTPRSTATESDSVRGCGAFQGSRSKSLASLETSDISRRTLISECDSGTVAKEVPITAGLQCQDCGRRYALPQYLTQEKERDESMQGRPEDQASRNRSDFLVDEISDASALE